MDQLFFVERFSSLLAFPGTELKYFFKIKVLLTYNIYNMYYVLTNVILSSFLHFQAYSYLPVDKHFDYALRCYTHITTPNTVAILDLDCAIKQDGNTLKEN